MKQFKHAAKSIDEIAKELENCMCAYCVELQVELMRRGINETRKLHNLFRTSVTVLDLDRRATSYIYERHNIRTLADLVYNAPSELMKFQHIGHKSVNIIIEKLKRYDLKLGMHVPVRFLTKPPPRSAAYHRKVGRYP
jgi:DNA-directed RNA polymerase alpha subunit